MKIRWGRSEDGYVDSRCGRFKIRPLYCSCVKPQWYETTYYGKTISRWCSTQRDAKVVCQCHFDKMEKNENH